VSGAEERIVLDAGGACAVRLGSEALRVEGGSFSQRRRVPYRRIWGLERSGAWLWIGVSPLALGLGGRAVLGERLARLEAALRARVAALPDGAQRLARFDLRRSARLQVPWLTGALALGLLLATWLGARPPLRLATDALLVIALGLLAEPWLGALRTLASGAVGLATAALAGGAPLGLGSAALALALGWAGSLVFVRLRHERVLGVRSRSALDAGAPLAAALLAHALAVAPSVGAPLLAALAGFAVAPLLLRAGPEGGVPQLR
jgi:hypothetical protein